ncbi:TIGR01244 family sulfur transferase [Salinarimonas ramus]|uniref:TIGR01244 family protein n=1 Tax=Salinarimonas ramus TaxID=690164 RepID=A0A917QBB3_9HYPH|nr:TIGR01244 family sulfur transferase [Salinarimonas ramus]GGK41145.1 TIGR01244 family protein [Salinarimonas ramus]
MTADIRRLTPELSVAPQIAPDDLAAVKAAGFTTVINNRPDGESPDQPPSATMEAEAARVGLAYRHVPVVSGAMTMDDVAAFDAALSETDGPTLAFCRSGTRSATLWAFTQAGARAPDEILSIAGGAGYDLSGLRPYLERG